VPRNADRSLLRLSVRVGEIAVRDSRLVLIEERLDGDRVKVQDLATGESSAVELSSLRGRSAVANGASTRKPSIPGYDASRRPIK
jgi:hypothetical protein